MALLMQAPVVILTAERLANGRVLLDVEDLVPGGEYTLEASSPGLDRKLTRREDFERFTGSLVKVQTFEPIRNNRHWQGRIVGVGSPVSEARPGAPESLEVTGVVKSISVVMAPPSAGSSLGM